MSPFGVWLRINRPVFFPLFAVFPAVPPFLFVGLYIKRDSIPARARTLSRIYNLIILVFFVDWSKTVEMVEWGL